MRKTIAIISIIIILIFLGVGAAFVLRIKRIEKSSQSFTVVMTEEGFFPAKLSMKLGDKVTFVNQGKSLRWPASNIHPTHQIYTEFDPRQPVQPEDSWSFTFGKKGDFRFHDHLQPTMKGIITVR